MVECRADDAGHRTLLIVSEQSEHACTGCGLIQAGRVYDYRLSRSKDLPFGTRSLAVLLESFRRQELARVCDLLRAWLRRELAAPAAGAPPRRDDALDVEALAVVLVSAVSH